MNSHTRGLFTVVRWHTFLHEPAVVDRRDDELHEGFDIIDQALGAVDKMLSQLVLAGSLARWLAGSVARWLGGSDNPAVGGTAPSGRAGTHSAMSERMRAPTLLCISCFAFATPAFAAPCPDPLAMQVFLDR